MPRHPPPHRRPSLIRARERAAALRQELRSLAPMVGQLTAFTAALLFGFGTLTMGVLGAMQGSMRLPVGETWRVGTEALSPALPGLTLKAVVVAAPDRAAGSECTLGFGVAADQGGTLVITQRDPAGNYHAAWAGPGRSSRTGADCGKAAELELKADDMHDAQLGNLLGPLVGATGAL